MDFDEDRIYYSYQNLQSHQSPHTSLNAEDVEGIEDWETGGVELKAVRRHFREFLRNYRQKNKYLYRNKLLRMHQRTSGDDHTPTYSNANAFTNSCSVEVDLAHVGEYDAGKKSLL